MPDPPDKHDTPPTGSARLGPPMVPTLKTLSAQVAGMGGQIYGARKDLDAVLDRQAALQTDMTVIRRALLGEGTLRLGPLPSPASLAPMGGLGAPSGASPSQPPSSQPRPSVAVRAGKTTVKLAPWIVVALGVASQIAAAYDPRLIGAFDAILRMLGASK